MHAVDTVREMLKRGVLLSPAAVDALSRAPGLAANVEQSKLVVTLEDISPTRQPIILWSAAPTSGTASVNEITGGYSARHAFLRGLLEKKADRALLVSAASATNNGRVSIIGTIRDLYDGGALLEDGTSNIKIYTNERLMEDECVLVTGVLRGDGLVAESVAFPDVPMGRPIHTSTDPITCVFSFNPPQNITGQTIIITDQEADIRGVDALAESNDVVWPDGRSARALCPNTPCGVGVGGVKILIHRTTPAALAKITGAAEPEKAALRLLRARHLEPQRFILGDPLLLREVPDILCIATGVPFTTNYKGVTVVSPTIEQAYVVDLKTRAVRAV